MQSIEQDEQFTATVQTSQGSVLVPYRVSRSARARVIRLTMQYDNIVQLTLPGRVSLKRGLEFLQSQGDWLESAMKRAPVRFTLRDYLAEEPMVSAFGKTVSVHLSFTKVKPIYVSDIKRGELSLRFMPGEDEEAQIKQLLFTYAKEVIPPYVRELAIGKGLNPKHITVRDQSSRWGSCSGNKTLSLNWRLILLPPELHDYIIYHELAHLKEMNHSPRFWKLLQDFDPHALKNDREVSKWCSKLMSLGRF